MLSSAQRFWSQVISTSRRLWARTVSFATVTGVLTAVPAYGSTCPPVGKLYFSAQFGTSRLQIGTTPASPKGEVVAIIRDSRACQATCQIRELERATDRASRGRPIALSLFCEDVQLGALSSRATIFWRPVKEGGTVIRFGDWVRGYQERRLSVERDVYSQPRKTSRDLAVFPSSEVIFAERSE